MITTSYWIYFSIHWSLLSFLLFFLFYKLFSKKENEFSISIPILIIITLLMRVFPQILLPVGAGFDIQSYEIVGNNVLSKIDIYTSESTLRRYPYLPFQMYWSALAVIISRKSSIPFAIIVKIAPIIGDIAISIFIYLILKRKFDTKFASFSALLFALSPISIFVSAFHGQFDSIPIAIVLVSYYYFSRPFTSGLFLGVAILTKSWPVLFIPSFLRQQKKIGKLVFFLISIVLFPFLGIIFYVLTFNSSIYNVLKIAVSYNHGVGVWGYSYFIKIISQITNQNDLFMWFLKSCRFITLSILILVWIKIAYKQSLLRSMFIIILTFMTFTHAFSIQYLSWVIPFAILATRNLRWLSRYTISSFSYMFLAYHTLILQTNITNIFPWRIADHLIILAGMPAWLVCVGWFINETYSGKKP